MEFLSVVWTLGCSVHCLMNDERVVSRAKAEGITRAKAAVDIAVREIKPEIYVVGNAPTALIRLVEHFDNGDVLPELVVGMPVGFVNAAESKALLMSRDIPYISIEGRKGGSALAACVINALAIMLRSFPRFIFFFVYGGVSVIWTSFLPTLDSCLWPTG